MNFIFKNCLFLAPMAGYSDSSYRVMLKRLGADFSVSEFVHCSAILSESPAVIEKLKISEHEGASGIQIFGSDPNLIAESAVYIEENFKPAFIDINFGCPASSAVGANAGSALLKDTKQMLAIIEKTASALKHTPLSAKLRTGWSSDTIIVPEIINELANAGAKMLTLHGRTAKQAYKGDADWNLIEQSAKLSKVPLIGNGSVEKLDSNFFKNSHCFGFMVGRAALNDPWVFQKVRAKINNTEFVAPEINAALALAKDYIVYAENNELITKNKFTHMKAQIVKFLKGGQGFKAIRIAVINSKSFDDLKLAIF